MRGKSKGFYIYEESIRTYIYEKSIRTFEIMKIHLYKCLPFCLFVFALLLCFAVLSSLLRNLSLQFSKFKDLKFLSLPLIGGRGRVTAKVSLCLPGIYHLISL